MYKIRFRDSIAHYNSQMIRNSITATIEVAEENGGVKDAGREERERDVDTGRIRLL